MPTSLPPLPEEINENSADAEPQGSRQTDMSSAFSGGLPPALEAARQIESGYKMLAMAMPSAVPMCAQAISQLRMMMTPPDAGAAPGMPAPPPAGPGPAGPAITGATHNPIATPPPLAGM